MQLKTVAVFNAVENFFLLNFPMHFYGLDEVLNILEKKISLKAYAIPKFWAPKNIFT